MRKMHNRSYDRTLRRSLITVAALSVTRNACIALVVAVEQPLRKRLCRLLSSSCWLIRQNYHSGPELNSNEVNKANYFIFSCWLEVFWKSHPACNHSFVPKLFTLDLMCIPTGMFRDTESSTGV